MRALPFLPHLSTILLKPVQSANTHCQTPKTYSRTNFTHLVCAAIPLCFACVPLKRNGMWHGHIIAADNFQSDHSTVAASMTQPIRTGCTNAAAPTDKPDAQYPLKFIKIQHVALCWQGRAGRGVDTYDTCGNDPYNMPEVFQNE